MARQPLNSRLPRTGVAFGPGFLAERPKAAALIAECVATWSEIELQTGMMIASLLGVPFEPVTAFYLNLANKRDKEKTLDPIAKFVFDDAKHWALYEALKRARSSSEAERTEFAHSLFGIATEDPHGVIMISTTDRIKHMIEIQKLQQAHFNSMNSGGSNTDNSKQINDKIQDIRSLIQHYEIKDLDDILGNMRQLHRIIPIFSGFAKFLLQNNTAEFNERYDLLSSDPFLKKFCQKESKA